MKLSNRRVGIISTASHFIAFGGAGQFIKGLYEQVLKPEGAIVDLICDKEPADMEFLKALDLSGTVYYPKNPLPYSKHVSMFSFSDSANLEKEINLRDALFQALSENIYDTIIINSIEGISPVHLTGIQRFVKVVCYTHVEFSIGLMDHRLTPFSRDFIAHYGRLIGAKDFIMGTQSAYNAESIKENFDDVWEVRVLPMLLPENALLTVVNTNKRGVLFNGRWEPRKRPEEFVALIKESGLPAKVMTGPRGVAKFEKAFKEAGITDYEIKSGIFGQEKVDFISSAKLVYHPSRHENFSFSCLEGMAQCPVIVDGDCYWHKNFESEGFALIKTTKENRAKYAKFIHEQPVEGFGQLKEGQEYDQRARKAWLELLSEDHPHTPTKTLFTANDDFLYGSYMEGLGRKPSIEDVHGAHKAKTHYKRQQLKAGTFLSTTGKQHTIKGPETSLSAFFD